MKARQPTVLSSFTARNPALRSLLSKASELDRLTRQLREQLPEDMAPHCAVGRADPDALVLVADSPAWASRLRYLSRNLLRMISQSTGIEPKKLKVRIAPVSSKPPPRRIARKISRDSAAQIERLAEHTGDENLARALRQLASRGKQRR